MIFENRAGVKVKDILPDDEANKAFDKLDRNITGVDWEAETEIQDTEAHMPQLNNNQCAALTGREDNEGNDKKSTGVDNDGKITGVDSDNESAESGSTRATDGLDKLALIEEAIAKAEQDITEGTDLLAGTETITEEAQNENVIHPDLQVLTMEHTYNLW